MTHRDYILLYINGRRVTVTGKEAFMPLANFLRYEREQTGTKIVCAEGDCGACTVLRASPQKQEQLASTLSYQPFNSCIMPVFLLDCCSVVTVEGLSPDNSRTTGALEPIQEAFVRNHASQCGFCTPGFIMATAGLYEKKDSPSKKDVQNYLTGNLCRCTGYDSIIQAGCSVETEHREKIQERYAAPRMTQELVEHLSIPIKMELDGASYYAPCALDEAVAIHQKAKTRLVAGATDLGVQINKGRLKTRDFLSLRLIDEVNALVDTGAATEVGAKVSWERLRVFVKGHHPEFAAFLHLFASPQIKNVGTLIGNIANASPIGDSIPYLMIAESDIHLAGPEGRRSVPITSFYKGYKDLDLRQGELITSISIPKPKRGETIRLYKISARRDLDISCVNMACAMTLTDGVITDFRIAYGGVGPVVLRIGSVEQFLRNKQLTPENIKQAVRLVPEAITPLSDVRGSRTFRMRAAQNLLRKFFFEHKRHISSPAELA